MNKKIVYCFLVITLLSVSVFTTPVKAIANGTGTISGYVRYLNGNPVSGATVISHDGTTFRSSTTNSSGFYTLTSVPATSNHLQVSYQQYALSHYWGFVVADGGNYQNINFTIRPGDGTISGKVTGSLGEALGNVAITVWTKSANGYDDGSFASTTTDANGYYQTITGFPMYGLPTGTHSIQAVYNGATLTLENVAVTAGLNNPNNNFVFITGSPAGTATISGFIRDENGNPLSGAEVISHDGVTFRSTTSDYTGAYTLSAVPPNPSHLQAKVNGRALSHYWGFKIAPDGVYNNINFTLQPGGGTISGRVIGPDGNGLGNVVINIWQKTNLGYDNGAWATTTTDLNGYYQTSSQNAPGPGLPTGSYFVQASYGTIVSKDNIMVFAGHNTPNVNLAFIIGTGSISGHIKSETTGQGLSNVSVYLDSGITQSSSFSDASGNYLNGGLPTGNYNVVLSKNGYANAHQAGIEVSNGMVTSNINFVLTSQIGKISGLVTDKNGTPIVGAQIFADSDQGTGFSNTVTGSDGRYTLDNLAPMLYYVHVNADSYSPMLRHATAYGSTTTPNIDFVVGTAAGSISGQITKDGQPASYASVFINSSGGAQNVFYGNAVADVNGYYLVGNLEPGSYDVHISGVNGYANLVTFFVNVSTTTILNFNLTAGTTTIKGRVTDPNGNPIAGAKVQPFNNANPGTWDFAITDANGYYTVSNLWSGLYTIYANKSGFEGVVKYYLTMTPGENQVDFVMGLPRAITLNQKEVTVIVKDNFGTYRSLVVQVTSGVEVNWSATSQVEWLLLDSTGHTHAQSGCAGAGLFLRIDPLETNYGTYTTNLVLTAPDAQSATVKVTIIKVPANQYHQIFIPSMSR